MIFYPPAKLNLGLKVLNKREDGFHNIESVIFRISLCDILEVLPSNNNRISYSGIQLEEGTEFIGRMLAFLNEISISEKFSVHLHKRIPIGAGLGGGSSDLACFVRCLLENARIENDQKQRIQEKAFEWSSDAYFFLQDHPVFVSGKGDILEEQELDLYANVLLLVMPEIKISTKEAYSRIKPKNNRLTLHALKEGPRAWKNVFINDFEQIADEYNPFYSEIKDELYKKGAIYVSLTGTGSFFYAIFQRVVEDFEFPPNWKYKWVKKL